jgi:hypothetical protein
MSMRLRLGPVSLSSSGRVGVHAGPVSVYGGGRRRRSGGGFVGLLLVMGVIGAAIEYWYVSVPLAVLVGALAIWALHARNARQAAALSAWLACPPPPLPMPGRFTENWLAANVPTLHPGQIPMLERELRARGWAQARIDERVGPYIAMNPYAGGR